MNGDFILDHRLQADSTFVWDLQLSQIRLSNNASFPWMLLIPRKPNMVELLDLEFEDQIQLQNEIRQISQTMKQIFFPDKLNIASLGNIVSQLHIHIIARYKTDKAWPNPIWGCGITSSYTDSCKINLIKNFIIKLKCI
jgi:diadenosine tetraphosphate (Ap4A) HIT family hydrolase